MEEGSSRPFIDARRRPAPLCGGRLHVHRRGGCGLTNVSGQTDQTWRQRERAMRSLCAGGSVTDMKQVEVCVSACVI